MLNWIWLVPVFPLCGVIINGLFGKKHLKPKHIHYIACTTVFLSFVVAVLCFFALLRLEPRVYSWGEHIPWITSGKFHVSFNLLLDPLSAIMILVVTGVGFLIHVYSTGYMHGEEGYYRYFTYLNLFMAAMLTLVLGGNFLLMFVGWEGVGLCSYLLIGYWFERKSASDAGKKAFLVNRVGDFGFALGIMLIFVTFGTLDFQQVFTEAPAVCPKAPEVLGMGVATAITLLLFVGAVGKSAQIPLYVWLPDAMEGPTPVSALIHAATMVTAGVYMVARCNVLFTLAPGSMMVVAVIGACTAIFAASIGLVQNDIKRVLAYSTVSQLGYMFLACGVGAFGAGIFHLTTHAFFKALLFLGSGSVIHAMGGEMDIRKMGGLYPHIKITAVTFWVAALAIAGIFPLSGFFSKDEILWKAFSGLDFPSAAVYGGAGKVLWLVGFAAAGMTAFYMFRLIFLTFHGKSRVDDEVAHHLHESPYSMTVPLMILAVLAAVAGILGVPTLLAEFFHLPHGLHNSFHEFLSPVFHHVAPLAHGAGHAVEHSAEVAPHAVAAHPSEAVEWGLMGLSLLVALTGIGIAYTFYIRNPDLPKRLGERLSGVHRVLLNKYYVDEIYDIIAVNHCKWWGNILWRFDDRVVDGTVNGVRNWTVGISTGSVWADMHIVDRIVNWLAETIESGSVWLRQIQTGQLQNYGLAMALGVISLGVFLVATGYVFLR